MRLAQIKNLIIVTCVSISFNATAQVSAEAPVTNSNVSDAKVETAPVKAANEIVIINNAPAAATASTAPAVAAAPTVVAPVVAEQPTTVITAAPITISEAEQLRKAREKAEIETEQKIVEKLEKSRLDDEQKRLDKLFKSAEEVKPSAPVEASAAVAAAPVVVVEPKQEVGTNSEAVQTIKIEAVSTVAPEASTTVPAATAEAAAPTVDASPEAQVASVATTAAEVMPSEKSEENEKKYFVGGIVSSIEYPDAFNTSSDFATGFSVGFGVAKRLQVEASFVYSAHTIDESYSFYKEVDQYNWMIATRYSFFNTKLTPVLGALASYTRREYTEKYDNGFTTFTGPESASSNAFDFGLMLGVDFNASKNLTFGLEYKYITNLNSRYDEPEAFNRSVYQTNNKYYQTLEDIDYDMIGLTAKFAF